MDQSLGRRSIHLSNSSSYTIPRARRRSAKGGAAKPAFFLASSAPLSADAYSSTQPVCIYTDMFVCCWFPDSQSAPLVSALLFFTLSFFFLPVGAPLPLACVVPASLHKTSQEAHLTHRVTITSQNHSTAVDHLRRVAGGRRIGFLPDSCFSLLSVSWILTCFNFEATCFFHNRPYMFLHFLIGSISLVVMIGGRRRGGVKNWYKRIVLSAEWIQHLSLLLCSHVHDASRPEQSAGMVYFWMIAKS